MKKALTCCLICLSILSHDLDAQRLNNPSFEGEAMDATMPVGWHSCQEGTTPDILPGPWGVTNRPKKGQSYVGLITRPDGSFEAIGQRFSAPVLPKRCYLMSLSLGHSNQYAGYEEAGRIRIWLGRSKCARDQLIFDKVIGSTTEWKTFPIRFNPEASYPYLIIENLHTPGRSASRSHILIDDIHWPIECERT